MFSTYLNNCPVIRISGRVYPVTVHYLDDINKLVADGQKMVATDRGKSPADLTPSKQSNSKKSNKAKAPISNKKDDSFASAGALAIKPPPFDAERIAEIIIRIITVHSKGITNVGSATTITESPSLRRIDLINEKAAKLSGKAGSITFRS